MTLAPLVFLDTETTGLHPGRQVWEFGAIRRDFDAEGKFTEVEHHFFLDVDLAEADPFGLAVGRYWERHPSGRYIATLNWTMDDEKDLKATMEPAQAAELVAIVTHGAHIVGAVPNFDTQSLEPLLRAHGHLPMWHHHLVDVEALALGFLAGRASAGLRQREGLMQLAPPWQSRELSAALGIHQPEHEKHTALGDAYWAKAIYDYVMGGGS